MTVRKITQGSDILRSAGHPLDGHHPRKSHPLRRAAAILTGTPGHLRPHASPPAPARQATCARTPGHLRPHASPPTPASSTTSTGHGACPRTASARSHRPITLVTGRLYRTPADHISYRPTVPGPGPGPGLWVPRASGWSALTAAIGFSGHWRCLSGERRFSGRIGALERAAGSIVLRILPQARIPRTISADRTGAQPRVRAALG
jgi:hypothetical protein